ncbi:MAG: DUF1822 family protein [Synechococcales bacterium]|nr:DUF1822 family protein [Synechococcales bacterium]
MPLSLKAHHLADQFRQQQSTQPKAKQVYLNTLAVCAVNEYLKNLGIETHLEAGDSWDTVVQSLADVADLTLPGRGKLECRPVLPDAEICSVPPEVWGDRLGYVAVQFDPALREATLLGYVPSVTAEELPLSELRSLDELIDLLSPAPPPEPVHLGQWLAGVVEAGWQALDEALRSPQPAFSFRSGSQIQLQPPNTADVVAHGKLLNLPSQTSGDQLALIVGLMPTATFELDVWVKVCPQGDRTHLPPDLELMVLDEQDTVVMQAQSRNTEMIQLRFGGQPGERFSIRVVLGAMSVTEAFVV